MRRINKEEPDFYKKMLKREHPMTWEDVSCKTYLRIYMLCEEQKFQCAYTETRIEPEDSHTDHFVKQSFINQGYSRPLTVFSWRNLFVSCNSEFYGAKHKDKKIKIDDYLLLINPSIEGSSNYFEYSWTGEILVDGYNEKALKTIEIFNLNDFALVEQRKVVAFQIKSLHDQLSLEEILDIFGQFESLISYLYHQLIDD